MANVIESDMLFGEYPDDNFFRIENSDLHKSVGKGIRAVEFVLLNKNELLFVEAKKSCPNAKNKDDNKVKKIKFEEYYSEITDKFLDSLNMFLSGITDFNEQQEGMGNKIKNKKLFSKSNIRFVLVIKDAKDVEWLAGPKAILDERLKKIRKIWKAEVIVHSYETAMAKGLIKGSVKEEI
jgi:hypothetical protein